MSIGQILAMSGQRVGSQLGDAYGGFGRDVGGMLSGISGNIRGKREEREAMQMLEQLQDDPEGLAKMAQQYGIQGNTQLATVFQNAAQAAITKQNRQNNRGLQGALQAITQGAMRGIPLTSDKKPDLRSAVQSALQLGGTQDQIVAAYKAGLKGGDVKSSRSGGQYRDEDDNIYELSIQRTPEGEGQVWLPITKCAPPTPVGKVTPIGGAYGETAGQKMERDVTTAGESEGAKGYAQLRTEAIDSLPQIEAAIYSAEKSLEVLNEIDTGGFSTAVVRAATDFLGVTPGSEAEFNLLAGQQILRGLNAFEGAISEGEREFLASLYQRLERSNGANKAILLTMIDESRRLLRDAKARANSRTEQEYLDNRESYDAPLKQPNKKVSWSDLQRGS
jgi:hypothetical protein